MVYVLGIEVVKQYEHVKSEQVKSVKSEQVKSVNVFVFNKPNHFRIKEKSSKAEVLCGNTPEIKSQIGEISKMPVEFDSEFGEIDGGVGLG